MFAHIKGPPPVHCCSGGCCDLSTDEENPLTTAHLLRTHPPQLDSFPRYVSRELNQGSPPPSSGCCSADTSCTPLANRILTSGILFGSASFTTALILTLPYVRHLNNPLYYPLYALALLFFGFVPGYLLGSAFGYFASKLCCNDRDTINYQDYETV